MAEYLVDLNATQAAIRAGYSTRTANRIGAENLSKPDIAQEIQKRQSARIEKAELTAAATLEAIRRQVNRDVRRLFDAHGNARPLHELSAEDAAMIAGFEVVIKNAAAGDGVTDRVLKVRLQDQAKYVDLAAKHFALLVERIQVTTDDENIAKLHAGRQRAAAASRAGGRS